MGDAHITVVNVEGDDPKRRWHTTEIYKVSAETAKELDAMKQKPTGAALQSWVQDHGGVIDDGNGHAGRVSTKNDGTQLVDHYKNGEFTTSELVRPKGAKANDHAGAELLLAVLTGGTSLFIPHNLDTPAAPADSKFGTTAPAAPAEHATADQGKVTKTTTAPATTRPKP